MADKKQPRVQIVTPAGIAAYAYFHRPDTKGQYSDNKFKGDLVLPGDVDLSAQEDKIRAFAAQVFPGIDLTELKLPWSLVPEDHKKEEFRGKTILKAKSKFAPDVIDTKRRKLPKKIEARSGDEVRFVCQLYAYAKTEKVKIKEGKKVVEVEETIYGVSLQLQVVQLIRKNAGGGGIGMLDDIDGFDAETDWEGDDTDNDTGTDETSDDGGDF